MTKKSAYEAAEERLHLPPARRRLENENPPELSFWQLLREDFETHDCSIFEQGCGAVANPRFGNWRLGLKNVVLRASCSPAHGAFDKAVVLDDVPEGATAVGNPARVAAMPARPAQAGVAC